MSVVIGQSDCFGFRFMNYACCFFVLFHRSRSCPYDLRRANHVSLVTLITRARRPVLNNSLHQTRKLENWIRTYDLNFLEREIPKSTLISAGFSPKRRK